MKRIFSTAFAAVTLALCLLAAPARAAGPSANLFPAKSPLRYHVLRYNFAATTSNITGGVFGALPPGGCIIRDVVVNQTSAGAGGTSWAVDVKRAAVSTCSTNGAFTQAAGDAKVTNTAASPMGALANPTGGTRPILKGNVQASGTVTVAASLAADEKVTIAGVDFVAKSADATGNQFLLGADENAAAANLAAAINASSNQTIRGGVVATVANAVVTIKARTPGSAGNAITLAKTGAHLTVSGSGTLASGFDAMSTGGELLTADITLTGTYSTGVAGVITVYCEPRN